MKKKIFILSLIIILITSVLSVATMAASNYSFTVSMTANNSRVEAGGEVLITVKLSNLNVGENGINSFSAYLSYDTNVFEALTDSSVDGINGWVPNYTTGTGKVQLYKQTFLKSDEEIMQISLKTKAGVTDGTTGDVKLSTIIVSNSSDEIMASPVSTTITVGSGSAAEIINPNTNPNANSISIVPPTNTIPIVPTNNTVSNVANNTSVITPTVNNTQVENKIQTESDSDIPYTGTDSNALVRIIMGVIFIGLVIYIKIDRMNKDIR